MFVQIFEDMVTCVLCLCVYVCTHQMVPLHWDEPGISVQMYNVAISLIESFDTMEDKDRRSDEPGVMGRGCSVTSKLITYYIKSKRGWQCCSRNI